MADQLKRHCLHAAAVRLQAAEGLNDEKSSELRSCVKEEVYVLGSPSLIVRAVSLEVKQ